MQPLIGLVVPPASGAVPPEAEQLYGRHVRFTARGVGVGAFAMANYEAALQRVPAAVAELMQEQPAAIGVMGTSLTFVKGRAYTDGLRAALRAGTGLPVTTMAHAIVEGLQAVGARRVAVAAAYDEEVTGLLVRYLREFDFEVAHSACFGIVESGGLGAASTERIVSLAHEAADGHPVDALLISCGGLRTLEATVRLEPELGIPVVSSALAGPWSAVRLLGMDGAVANAGRLLAPRASPVSMGD